MRRLTFIAFSALLAALPGCSGLMVTGDERGGTRVGKVAARSLLGIMTVGMSELPYACVRRELSTLPESERPLRRHELWVKCQQQLAQGTDARWPAPPWQHSTWQDLERQRRAEKQHLLLLQQQYQRQQLYQQRLYQRQQYRRCR